MAYAEGKSSAHSCRLRGPGGASPKVFHQGRLLFVRIALRVGLESGFLAETGRNHMRLNWSYINLSQDYPLDNKRMHKLAYLRKNVDW
jgi:hypothetical protein